MCTHAKDDEALSCGGRLDRFEPFTARAGIEIRITSGVNFAKLAAQARSGNCEYDISWWARGGQAQQRVGMLKDHGDYRLVDDLDYIAGRLAEPA